MMQDKNHIGEGKRCFINFFDSCSENKTIFKIEHLTLLQVKIVIIYDTKQLLWVKMHVQYMAIFITPPPKKKEIKPENMHHGQGREFHNIVSGQYEDNNNACLFLQRQ